MLIAHRGEVVSVERLIDEVWQDSPPARSRDTLQAHLAHLRRALGRESPSLAIERQGPGYTLHVSSDALDAESFEGMVDHGRRALAGGAAADAAAELRAALDMWRGTPFAGIDDVPSVDAERARLEQLRRDALEEWVDAELSLDRGSDVIPHLEALLAEDPWRERATGQLMIALYRAGRQVDSLATYGRLRTSLADELGLVPSPELQALESDILRQVPELSADRRLVVSAPVDSHLRGALPFVGRQDEMGHLLDGLQRASRGERVVALAQGEAGAGKSRLARELAMVASSSGFCVLSGRCDEDPLAPYQPFLEAIGGYVERVGACDSCLDGLCATEWTELARVIPQLALRDPTPTTSTTPGAPAFERLRFFDAVVRFFQTCSPVVLVVDDLHWADGASLVLLRHIIRTSQDLPILVLATSRVGEAGSDTAAATIADARQDGTLIIQLTLGGLDKASVATLAHAAVGDAAATDASLVGELWRSTNGNPFFVRELLRDLSDEGGWQGRALGVPATIGDAIDVRLSRRSAGARDASGGRHRRRGVRPRYPRRRPRPRRQRGARPSRGGGPRRIRRRYINR